MSELSKDALEYLIDVGRRAIINKPIEAPDGTLLQPVPVGVKLEALPNLNPRLPDTIKQAVAMHDLASFIAYIDKHRTDTTALFAEPGHLADGGQARIIAVLDYHDATQPQHTKHVVTYAPRYADEWKRWTAGVKQMEQVPFAEFIEENRRDVQAPPAATLLDLVRTFKQTRKVQYDSVVYQPNGNVKIGFSDESQPGGTEVPQMIDLAIPVFFGGDRYKVSCFLRYRTNGPKLTFEIKPDRPEYVEQDAFERMVASLRESLGAPCYIGKRV